MRILSADLVDFRNIGQANLRFSERLNAFVGPNGQGKTNLIEGLYAISALRPLRPVPRIELIRAGSKRTRLTASVLRETTGLVHELSIELSATQRQLFKDGKKCPPLAFLGHAVSVSFTPDDLAMTKGGPEGRRRFLDRAILNSQSRYLETALRYARTLKARNRVLAEDGSEVLLESYDRLLAAEGAEILAARLRYVATLAGRVAPNFERIAHPAPSVRLRYRSNLSDIEGLTIDQLRDLFEARLGARHRHDRRRKATSVGPHLDDLELFLDEAPAKVRASQGQHRALVLAIKLAEITQLTADIGEPPVLLLDDISSELDSVRSSQLFKTLSALDGQILMTTTDHAQVPDAAFAAAACRYDVRAGAFIRSSDSLSS